MYNVDIVAFNIFVITAIVTPGPGNITSSSMGMTYGYKGSFRFIIGNTLGYLLVMVFSAFLSNILIDLLPILEPVLRVLGTSYILLLAFKTVKSTYSFSTTSVNKLCVKQGFLLQVLNPKSIIFGLTIYTTLLYNIHTNMRLIWFSIFYLSSLVFCSVSLWAVTGSIIKRFLHIDSIRIASNIIITILLVYCAVMISGILMH